MRRPSALLLVAVFSLAMVLPCLGAEQQEPAIQARVEFATEAEWLEFMELPDLDIMKVRPGELVVVVTDAVQLQEFRSLGLDVTVEIDHMQEYYASRIRGDNFGAFHTYSETEDFMDDLHATYPSITSGKISIGTTDEGRDIWAFKISDNPGTNEDEPEVLFDGMHHAREIMTVEVQIHYMQWLCESYGVHPEATFLVDNREIWFIPIVNPDGFCYNEQTNPGGGGMWRKNRHDNAGSYCMGVDNNRNYPWEWGGVGSSGDPCDETYRGSSAGSELEAQAYMNFVADHEFITNISFHSVVGIILIPWSYTNAHTPDDALFRAIGDEMALFNGYTVGQGGEILYNCSGTTTDWNYGEHDILSFCIEVSGSGFWPNESEIDELNADCLWPQIYATRIAGSYPALDDYVLAGGNGDQKPDPGETLDLVVTIENQGVLVDIENVAVTLLTDDAYVQLHDAGSALGTIAAGESANNAGDPFSFTVDPTTPDGHGLLMTVLVSADGFSMEEEIHWTVGTPIALFFDDMEGGTGNWIENDGRWGITGSQYNSPTNSYTDSPSGNYSNQVNTWIALANPLDFSQASTADLSFWHRFDTEDGYDFCYVEGSIDGGANWTQIGPKYEGNNYAWEEVNLSLADFVGSSQFKLRFRLKSDTWINEDGWYVDDVMITGPPTGNGAPTAPTLAGPPHGGTVITSQPELVVNNASDPDPGDELTYGFAVYSDALFTDVVASATGVPEGSGTTAWIVSPSLGDGTYWWRAHAFDGAVRGSLMAGASFVVEAGSGVGEDVTSVRLRPTRPNPFAGETHLSFEMPGRRPVELAIYSVHGRLVRTLVSGEAGPGLVEVRWDGRDEKGEAVGSGLYLARLETYGELKYGKLVVVK